MTFLSFLDSLFFQDDVVVLTSRFYQRVKNEKKGNDREIPRQIDSLSRKRDLIMMIGLGPSDQRRRENYCDYLCSISFSFC